jgi:Protein of unknown function (DUF2167)
LESECVGFNNWNRQIIIFFKINNMKLILIICTIIATNCMCFAQTKEEIQHMVDSIEKTLHYQKKGTIVLQGIGAIKIPVGYKYLNKEDAERVLVELWNNPRYDNMTLGMLVQEDQKLMAESTFATNIEYYTSGYINQFELEHTNFNRLLKQLNNRIKELKIEKDSVILERWTEFPKYNATKNIYNYGLQFYIKKLSYRIYNGCSLFFSNEGCMIFTTIGTNENLILQYKNKVEDAFTFDPNLKYANLNASIDTSKKTSVFTVMRSRFLNRKGLVEKLWKNKNKNNVNVGIYNYENVLRSKQITEVTILKEVNMNKYFDIQAGISILQFGIIFGPRFKIWTGNNFGLSLTQNIRVTSNFVSSFTAINIDIGKTKKFRISPLYNTEISNFNKKDEYPLINPGTIIVNSYPFKLKGFGIQCGVLFNF